MELRNQDCKISLFDIGTVRFPLVVGVRVKHIPSGLVAECSAHRNAHANARDAKLELEQLIADYTPQEKVMPYDKETADEPLRTAQKRIVLLHAALEDLAMCMQGVIDEEYEPDSFTLQAARKALAETSEYSKFILCYAEPAAVVGWKSNIPNTMLEIHLEGVWELGDTFHRPVKEME